jgi:uncharacterized protein DUF4926
MLKEHDVVALTEDAPTEGLAKGDVGAVVHGYGRGDNYEVEFIDERGRTKRIASIPASQLMKLNLLSLTT